MLQAKQFSGLHSGESITTAVEEMLNAWKILKNIVHVVRDASNVIKAMDQSCKFGMHCAHLATHGE